ncbi:TPA: mCG58077-like [Bos taurus]|nr:TPA: mCG58077-like [Bos taurus]
MADEICTPEEVNINVENTNTEQLAPRTKKKEQRTSRQSKTKAQKNSVRRTLQNKSRKKSQPFPSYPRVSNRRIRPTTFICYHRLKNNSYKHKLSSYKKQWKIQPFKVTSCANSKCRAWARALEQAVSMEAAMKKRSKT